MIGATLVVRASLTSESEYRESRGEIERSRRDAEILDNPLDNQSLGRDPKASERFSFSSLPYWLAITFRWRLCSPGGCCCRCCWPRSPRIRFATHASASAMHGTPPKSRECAATIGIFSPVQAGPRISSPSAWPRAMVHRIPSATTAAPSVARSGSRSSSVTVAPVAA